MRADAQRNRQSIIDATIELLLEVGGEPSRDTVADRAGVGIATLYRHFPDQPQLFRAATVEVLNRAIREGQAALEESATGGEALRRYLHATIDGGLGAVGIVYPLLDDHDWPDQRDAARRVLDRLVKVASREGAIGPEYTTTDLAFAAIRFCRPLATGLDPVEERAIAHQQLTHYLDGLAVSSRSDTASDRQ